MYWCLVTVAGLQNADNVSAKDRQISILNDLSFTVKPRFTAQFGGTEKGAVNRGKR